MKKKQLIVAFAVVIGLAITASCSPSLAETLSPPASAAVARWMRRLLRAGGEEGVPSEGARVLLGGQ